MGSQRAWTGGCATKDVLLLPWRLLKYEFVGLDIKGVYFILGRDLMQLVRQGKCLICC